MIRFDAMRAALERADFNAAQSAMSNIIRQVARARAYRYAVRNNIVDFNDQQLVEQSHRDFRDSLISSAMTRVTQAQSATTTAELLAIFDAITQVEQ